MVSRTVIKRISDHVAEIGKTGDAQRILQTELAMLQEERNYLSNSTVQKGSLDTAIEGLNISLNLLEKVRSPESYRDVDENHSTRKRRSGGLPLDEAREFFKSHNSRLLNLDKAILSDEEKELIDIRRANIRKAGNGVRYSAHWSRRSRNQVGLDGRAFGPLSPPAMIQSRKGSEAVKSTGPNRGSQLTNLIAAGISVKSGTRSLARF